LQDARQFALNGKPYVAASCAKTSSFRGGHDSYYNAALSSKLN
jgi:hypothetical protein